MNPLDDIPVSHTNDSQASSHYNTTNLSGADLQKAERKAETQEDLILGFFRERPNIKMGPSTVWRWFKEKNWPITSIRRAITNLEHKGLLEKTETMEQGEFGVREYCWQLKQPKEGQQITWLTEKE